MLPSAFHRPAVPFSTDSPTDSRRPRVSSQPPLRRSIGEAFSPVVKALRWIGNRSNVSRQAATLRTGSVLLAERAYDAATRLCQTFPPGFAAASIAEPHQSLVGVIDAFTMLKAQVNAYDSRTTERPVYIEALQARVRDCVAPLARALDAVDFKLANVGSMSGGATDSRIDDLTFMRAKLSAAHRLATFRAPQTQRGRYLESSC